MPFIFDKEILFSIICSNHKFDDKIGMDLCHLYTSKIQPNQLSEISDFNNVTSQHIYQDVGIDLVQGCCCKLGKKKKIITDAESFKSSGKNNTNPQ